MPRDPNVLLRQLHAQMRVLQRRLGTAVEEAEDIDRVVDLAHEINNELTAARIEATMAGQKYGSLLAFWRVVQREPKSA